MNALALSTGHTRTGRNKVVFVLLALLLGLLLIVPVFTPHAVERHGADAETIRRCLIQNGPFATWRANDNSGVRYQIVRIAEDLFGFMPIKFSCRLDEWVELSSYFRGDGSWKALFEYLKRNATFLSGKAAP